MEKAAGYAAVFDYFGVAEADRPEESCYAFAPVFRTRVGGVPVALKRTRNLTAAAAIMRWVRRLSAAGVPVVTPVATGVANPALIGDRVWVAYPWVEGRPYDGSAGDIAAAGDLLGRMHVGSLQPEPDLPLFEWPDYDNEEVEDDIAGLRRVLASHAPEIAGPVLDRVAAWHRTFPQTTLQKIRDAGLPCVTASTDFKANNLVYTGQGPVLVDPDNADYVPRLIDLAMAALLFHNELASAPPRLFTSSEWDTFARAYTAHVTLTPHERDLWPTALQYLITEWGTWTLVNADQCGDWSDPHKHAFLTDLAQTMPDRYSPAPLGLD
jgi:Ser/Thr protein kinase RdoA (MazF antagonist)